MKRFVPAAVAAALLAALALACYGIMNSRTFQFFGGAVSHVETDQKRIALTFDDRPSESTDDILAILDKAGVKATFFLVGRYVMDHARPGSIVLLHAMYDTDAIRAIGGIVRGLREKGYVFETVGQLLGSSS